MALLWVHLRFCFILKVGTACMRKEEEREGGREERKDKDDLTFLEVGENLVPYITSDGYEQ